MKTPKKLTKQNQAQRLKVRQKSQKEILAALSNSRGFRAVERIPKGKFLAARGEDEK